MTAKVDLFLEKSKRWKEEMTFLRTIVLENKELTEEYKWMHPCYTFNGKNVVLIHGFKEYCALLFFKGALLKDPKGNLIQQTKNVQAARQLRFTDLPSIKKQRSAIKEFIKQAIGIEKDGKKIVLKKTEDYPVPPEFKERLAKDQKLKNAFKSLTPGRQKAYLFYFSQAKQSQTRISRIEKFVPMILKGIGLND